MNYMKKKEKEDLIIKQLKNELKIDLEIAKHEYEENLQNIKILNLLN